ncbi:MAG: hypothetical protein Q9162_002178 [Coniocarpon cinnabarinum]
MNGFAHAHLEPDNFGPSANSTLKSFDAFPKTKQTYLTRASKNGGIYTGLLVLFCAWLTSTEVTRWFRGTTSHAFSVERGVGHELNINLDVVVQMHCEDLHINVQDASGDRIMAGETLHKDPTLWTTWTTEAGRRSINKNWGVSGSNHGAREEGGSAQQEMAQYRREEDVHDYLAAARGKKRFVATPKLGRNVQGDSCRIFGTLEGNKVQGDFHITARGHGYAEIGQHLDHEKFNFSHHINELSFGPFYPTLLNPLDATTTLTEQHFYKFQYYLSVVPTIYTDALSSLTSLEPPGPRDAHFNPYAFAPHTIFTNQYAVTEQSHEVPENTVPGIFVKFDIEPILLTISEEWGGLLGLVVRCVNVVAGILVAGGWLVSLLDWTGDVIGKRRRRATLSESGIIAGRGEKQGLE